MPARLIVLSLLAIGTVLIGHPVNAAALTQEGTMANVSFLALTCPAGLALEDAGPDTCTEPRDDIIVDYDKTLIEVEHITVTTDENGRASIDVPDPANSARFDIAQEDNQLYYPQSPGPQPGYGVYLADCGATGDDAGFSYTGLGIAFDELAAGDAIDCQLFFIPPAAASPVQLLSGSCNAIDEVVADLTPLTVPYGTSSGASVPAPVEVSLNTIGISLDEVLASDHAVVVYNEERDGKPILSCGYIGGVAGENESLAFGLPAQDGSRYSGIGVITPTDAGNVDIAVYMAPDLDGSDRDVSGVTGSQRADESSPAGVYAESCDDAGPADLVAELTPVSAADGEPVGAETRGGVEQSVATTDLTLDELAARDHVIAVFDEDAQDTALVCGPIGGILGEEGVMVVSLPALSDSLYSGVAVLTTTSEGTVDIAVYLAPDLDGRDL